MSKIKKSTVMLLAFVMSAAMLTAQGGTDAGAAAEDTTKAYKFTASSPFFLQTGVDYNDAMSQALLKKFNLTVEVMPVNLTDLANQNRIWISSGDMPDVTWSGFNFGDYKKYVDQGLIRMLPANYPTAYPDLNRAMNVTGIDASLKSKFDGKIYAVTKPIFVNKFADRFANHISLYYRQDWMKAVGLPIKEAYTLDEVMTIAKTFQEKDPGNIGKGKTVGFAVEPPNMIYTFLIPYNSRYDRVYKGAEGKYVYGPFQQSALEGLKTLRKYYEQGPVYKDFFTIKVRGEVEAMLKAGQTGLMINGGAFGNSKRIFSDFGATTKTDPLQTLTLANILGPDNKIHSVEFLNLQSVSYFSPKMEDAKFARILSMLNYLCTPEAQEIINLGFKGKDFTQEGDKVTITRGKDANGVFKPIADFYPSYNLWSQIMIPWDDFAVRDPSTDPRLLDLNKKTWNARVTMGDMAANDYDLLYFSDPVYDRLSTININNDFTNIVVNNADVEKAWNAWKEKYAPIVNDALNAVNKALVK